MVPALPDLAPTIGTHLAGDYYDDSRFKPTLMVQRALRALESSEASIDTNWKDGVIVLTVADRTSDIPAPEPATLEQAMALIERVRNAVDKSDLSAERKRDMAYNLVNGSLTVLDPHTVVMPPEPAKDFREDIAGEFFGIGAFLHQEDGLVSIDRVMAGLPADIPLIGFCGAPYTLAAYAIEGGSSRQFAHTKTFMYGDPGAWHALQQRLVLTLIPYLNAQITAGASCVQVFDSWVGHLTRADFIEFVQPHLTALVAGIAPGIPVILFGTETGHLSDLIAGCGADVIGVDTTTDLSANWDRCGGPGRIAVQGNLDPCLLLGPRERLLAGADSVLKAAAGRPGHIFNLGHGVIKETNPEQAKALVEHVHARTQR